MIAALKEPARGARGLGAFLSVALLYAPSGPGTAPRELAEAAREAGYEVREIGSKEASNPSELDPGKIDLLIAAGAEDLPAEALPAFQAYLAGGGDLLALGLPAFGRGKEALSAPHIESLCPAYQFFPISGPVRLETRAELALPGPLEPPKGRLYGIHPRPGGTGFEKGRRFRWQPVLEARSPEGDYRGAVGVLVVSAEKAFCGAAWCALTPSEPEFYRSPAARAFVRDLLERLRRGAFLLEGGATRYVVFPGEAVRLGARVASSARVSASGLSVRLSVRSGGDKEVFSFASPVDVPPGASAAVETSWAPESWPEGGYRVVVELLQGERTIDSISHELRVWKPREKPRFVEAKDGGLWLGGKPWKAHGVNYMPSSGVGLADNAEFEFWLDPAPYDPEVIERDLARIERLGFNAISAFVYHRSLESGNLLDFLLRSERHGLRVNLSLRPGTPMDFRWPEMREIVERSKLASSDVVMAYDLAWEPSHYGEAHQRSYAVPWLQWVARRYGSVEAAQGAWGVALPGAPEKPGVPPMRLLCEDGPWRALVADYRLFLDEFVGEKYREARRLLRTIDPRHPVSFRMQFSGDPTFLSKDLLPYDFWGLRDAVDIWEPEGYGRIGGWEQVKPGRFTADYARLCDPAKPVVWAEAGMSVWDLKRGEPDPGLLEAQAAFYRAFYRMLRESGADGVFFWWYPGGFRVNERSDFGIIEPDGTDRPVTRAIREEGPGFLAAPKLPPPDFWIEVDRDADARGLFGIYQAASADYWNAIEGGKTPGLRWRKKPGER